MFCQMPSVSLLVVPIAEDGIPIHHLCGRLFFELNPVLLPSSSCKARGKQDRLDSSFAPCNRQKQDVSSRVVDGLDWWFGS